MEFHAPCVVRAHGYWESIGHATRPEGAWAVFEQTGRCRIDPERFRVQRKLIRLDGAMQEAFVAEPVHQP